MTELLHIQEKIAQSSAKLAELNDALRKRPTEARSISLMINSVEKRLSQLQSEFEEISEANGIDVCSYRISPNKDSLAVIDLANAMRDFQRWVSILFDAVRTGAKATAHLSATSLELTKLNFAYTYPGSVGVVLTIPSERLLTAENDLAHTISVAQQLTQLSKPESIREAAIQYGPAPIRALYEWAKHHSNANLNVNILWKHGPGHEYKIDVQHSEFRALKIALENTGDTKEETITTTGLLRAVDVANKKFSLLTDDDNLIRGSFNQPLDEDHTVTLPTRYHATIRQITTTMYSSDKDIVEYILESLTKA